MSLMKKICILFFIFFYSSNYCFSEQIVYINMEKIMKVSKAGKKIIEKINKSNEVNINKFKKIEEDLKEQERKLISKQNVISEDEFKSKIEELRKKISEYRMKRQNIIQEATQKRIKVSAEFSNKIKPILGEYAAKNNISIIVQKKNIIMGKTELDITDDILKIVDEQIPTIKFE